MKILGLCGGSGSGKGYVASIFLSRSIVSIDTDVIYRELVSGPGACMSELVAAFGEQIATSDGALDRAVMRALVFSGDRAEHNRARLNEISHRHVLKEVRRKILEFEKAGVPAVIVDAPLLFESGFDKECDAVICVVAPLEVRLSRLMKRDGISKEAAISRISSQLSDEELMLRSDFVINNCGDDIALMADIDGVFDFVFSK